MKKYKATRTDGIGVQESVDEFVSRVRGQAERTKRVLERFHTNVEGYSFLPADWQVMGEVIVSIYFGIDKTPSLLSGASTYLQDSGYSYPVII